MKPFASLFLILILYCFRLPAQQPFVYCDPSTRLAGLKSGDGEILIEATWEKAGIFSDGLWPVSQKNQWGFVNEQGDSAIPYIYQFADNFRYGMAVVAENCFFEGPPENRKIRSCRYGLINREGEYILSPSFSRLFVISADLILAGNEKSTLFNASGDTIYRTDNQISTIGQEQLISWDLSQEDCRYDLFTEQTTAEGWKTYLQERLGNGQFLLIGPDGNPTDIVSDEFFHVLNDSSLIIKKEDQYYQLDASGKQTVLPYTYLRPLQYELFLPEAFAGENRYFLYRKDPENPKKGLLNDRLETLTDQEFEIFDPQGSLLMVSPTADTLVSFAISLKDQFYFNPVPVSEYGKMSEGRLRVYTGGKWGFLDEYGGMIIPDAYDEADDFESGWAKVKAKGEDFLISGDGRAVYLPQVVKGKIWTYNADGSLKDPEPILKNRTLHPSAEPRPLKELNLAEVQQLFSAMLSPGNTSASAETFIPETKACFVPDYGIVLYNATDQPLFQLSVSWKCGQIKSWPEWPARLTFGEIAALMQQWGVISVR